MTLRNTEIEYIKMLDQGDFFLKINIKVFEQLDLKNPSCLVPRNEESEYAINILT